MRISVLVIILSLLSITVVAQRTLSIEEAIKLALKNNVAIRQQSNQQITNLATRNSAMARTLPTITGTAQSWKTLGNQFIEQEARVVNDASTNNFFATANANLVLFNGFNRINGIKQANEQLEAQQFQIKRSEEEVISQVSSQYLQCLLDKEILNIEETNLRTQEQQRNQIQQHVELGSRAHVDLVNQDAQVKMAQLRVLRARQTLRNDKITLSQLMFQDPFSEFEIEEPKWNISFEDLKSVDPLSLNEVAMQNRADLQQQRKIESSWRSSVSINRSAAIPTLSFFASINSFYSNASTPVFNDQLDNNLRKQYGLTLNIPIFQGLQNRVSFVQAKVNYLNAQLDVENAELVVKSDVLRAYQNLNDANLNYEAARIQLEAADLAYALEKERYDIGIIDFVQFTQANQTLISAQTDFATARYTLLFQGILLDFATGTLKAELLID
ncbi:MAG TPA: TolC family protein [Cyclobacteriaceae bacterium]|nr:TolC family protein [Cyclobacteriaceae bacterium]